MSSNCTTRPATATRKIVRTPIRRSFSDLARDLEHVRSMLRVPCGGGYRVLRKKPTSGNY